MDYYFSYLEFSCYEWKTYFMFYQRVKKSIFPDFLYTDGMKIMNEYLGFAMVSFSTANIKSQKWIEMF